MENSMILVHHGIKGMRWGVRRTPEQLGRRTATRKVKTLSPERQARLDRKQALKNMRTMSTVELKERVARLETEKKLRELTEEDLYPGRKAVREALGQIGKKVVTTAVTGAALYGLKTAADKNFDAKGFGSAIFNGGPKK